MFNTREFMFSAAELFGCPGSSIESAFSKTCSFREDGLEVAYRRHLRSPITRDSHSAMRH